jgi:hypothetical protein
MAVSAGAAAVTAALPAAAQTATSSRAERVARDIRWLASDSLRGRKTGDAGNDSAAAYLARELRRLRLTPGGDSGTFFQRWTVGNSASTRQAGIAGLRTANLVAMLPGRGRLRGQAVVVGAHFDHLGMGGMGSLNPDSVQIHNGADDNASGTAALLEVARVLAGRRPRGDARAVVFVLFSGEEQGTLGSTWYTGNPAVQMDSTLAMLNFDMVGRLREGRLLVLGARTATEWPALLDSVNGGRFDLRASGDGWGPSDHAPFYARRRPVLHFFTDLHEQYHRPSDDAATVDADGIIRIADYAAELVQRLRTRPAGLTFVDVPPPQPVAAAGTGARPSLGTIPDMTDEPGGVRLSGVRSGSPADSAGLRQGDVLIGLGTHAITSLQDFQNALMAHQPGDRVEVRYRRGEQTVAVMVTLGGTRPPPRD